MKPILLRVRDEDYRALKTLADRTGRPVAELIWEALSEYLARKRGSGSSILDMPSHPSGAPLRSWTREELMDEMRER